MNIARRFKSFPLALLIAILALIAPAPIAAHGEEPHAEPTRAEAPAAPRSAAPAPGSAVSLAPEAATAVTEAQEPAFPLGTVLHNLHPVSVHFPIALLIAAALIEALGAARGGWRSDAAVRVMAVAGAIGAGVAALLGWYHTGLWFGGGGTIWWHRWIGTALVPLSILTAWLAAREGSRTGLRLLLALTAATVAVQGYLGGELGHGAGHLLAD